MSLRYQVSCIMLSDSVSNVHSTVDNPIPFVDPILSQREALRNALLRRALELLKSLERGIFDLTCRRHTKRNILELKDLQKEVQKSRSDVQRYLNLGWIGVCEMLAERDMGMNDLMGLWQKFHSFLLLLQHFYLKLEKILILWEKALYLLLFLLFSEFPNTLRPPCTTMPWTIWPSLVVLWGVCWMFYEELWGGQGELPLPTAFNVIELFEDIDPTNPSQGKCTPFSFLFNKTLNNLLVFDLNFDAISCNMSLSDAPHFDVPNPEPQLLLSVPSHAITSDLATSVEFTQTSLVNPADTISPPATNGIAATPRFSPIRSATETRPQEATQSRAFVPATSLVHRQPRHGQVGPSRSSKHSQTEKYFCNYSDCPHSQPGSGFKRKDHLDQHLRGPHRQTSVQRLRAKPAAASRICNSTATRDITGAPLQSKKRKRGSEEEICGSNLDKLEIELAEERRLRRLAEEDNRLLRQTLENYERMRNGWTG